jgi:hypothetical protein
VADANRLDGAALASILNERLKDLLDGLTALR